ncbi:MAG: UPF0149 family protein [Myxococcales bacterium]|nr:UPF0149 family protein [Myxococcales bacterium]
MCITDGGEGTACAVLPRGSTIVMKKLRQPLQRSELAEIEGFLAGTPDSMLLPQAHGFLTAIVSAPTMIMPSTWQPMLIGKPEFESIEQAKHIIGLVMRLYNQILTDLNDGREIGPLDSDSGAVGLWCSGYLLSARMDDEWCDDVYGITKLFPFGLLAGEFDLTGEENGDGEIIDDPSPYLEKCLAALPSIVLELHEYWIAWRRENTPSRTIRRSSKVGRNEPCSCGSGLKFKKCCGRTLH